jgi:hypothetical protein
MTNNMEMLRGRVDTVARKVSEQALTPVQIGFLSMTMALTEAAGQLRQAADDNLTPDQLRAKARMLERLSGDVALLGDAREA